MLRPCHEAETEVEDVHVEGDAVGLVDAASSVPTKMKRINIQDDAKKGLCTMAIHVLKYISICYK